MSNDVEKIIELYKKTEKAEEYKSQLKKIYEICRTKRDDIASAHFTARGNADRFIIEQELKGNTIYMTFEEILGMINI